MLTESQIKSALKRLPTAAKKSIELKDGGSRGAGRLAIVIRMLAAGPVAEWYAVAYRDGRRHTAKLGTYPALPLADARKSFTEDYAPSIAAGRDLPSGPHKRIVGADLPATIQALFDAYAVTLAGRRSHRTTKRSLDLAAKDIGPDKLACTVTSDDVTRHLAKIYARGAPAMARETRSHINTAFNFGLKSAFNYKTPGAISIWNLKANPVAAIATDPDAVKIGQRHLSPEEFRTLWCWLEGKDGDCITAPAIRLNMVCGQRWVEMLAISESAYDESEQMLFWEKTKNGRPHSLPLPALAARIVGGLHANAHGRFFPHLIRPVEPATPSAVEYLIKLFLKEHPGIPHFTPRDLRRTWKTLSGKAGLSKEIRDRLQNHALGDVGSKHYDRYDYLPERRAAMLRWNAFAESMIAGELRELRQVA